MLIIRNNQLKAFERFKLEDFKKRLCRFLAGGSKHPFPEDLYDKQIEAFIALARESGFTTEHDVAALAEVVFRSSGAFDLEVLPLDWQNVIYQYKVDPAVKLERLERLRGTTQHSAVAS